MLLPPIRKSDSLGDDTAVYLIIIAKKTAKLSFRTYTNYGKCSKISNTLKLRTSKIIDENNF